MRAGTAAQRDTRARGVGRQAGDAHARASTRMTRWHPPQPFPTHPPPPPHLSLPPPPPLAKPLTPPGHDYSSSSASSLARAAAISARRVA